MVDWRTRKSPISNVPPKNAWGRPSAVPFPQPFSSFSTELGRTSRVPLNRLERRHRHDGAPVVILTRRRYDRYKEIPLDRTTAVGGATESKTCSRAHAAVGE